MEQIKLPVLAPKSQQNNKDSTTKLWDCGFKNDYETTESSKFADKLNSPNSAPRHDIAPYTHVGTLSEQWTDSGDSRDALQRRIQRIAKIKVQQTSHRIDFNEHRLGVNSERPTHTKPSVRAQQKYDGGLNDKITSGSVYGASFVHKEAPWLCITSNSSSLSKTKQHTTESTAAPVSSTLPVTYKRSGDIGNKGPRANERYTAEIIGKLYIGKIGTISDSSQLAQAKCINRCTANAPLFDTLKFARENARQSLAAKGYNPSQESDRFLLTSTGTTYAHYL